MLSLEGMLEEMRRGGWVIEISGSPHGNWVLVMKHTDNYGGTRTYHGTLKNVVSRAYRGEDK